jgi:hypothetical protein
MGLFSRLRGEQEILEYKIVFEDPAFSTEDGGRVFLIPRQGELPKIELVRFWVHYFFTVLWSLQPIPNGEPRKKYISWFRSVLEGYQRTGLVQGGLARANSRVEYREGLELQPTNYHGIFLKKGANGRLLNAFLPDFCSDFDRSYSALLVLQKVLMECRTDERTARLVFECLDGAIQRAEELERVYFERPEPHAEAVFNEVCR